MNFWQKLGFATTAAEAVTPIFWFNVVWSIGVFVYSDVYPLVTPPIGLCEWYPAPSPAPPPPAPVPAPVDNSIDTTGNWGQNW